MRRQHGEELKRGGDRDAGAPDVWIVADAERLAHVGDLLAFGETTCRAGVGLGDVERMQAWAGQYLPGTWVNAVAFAVLVGVLIVRPAGLAGRAFYEARVETT